MKKFAVHGTFLQMKITLVKCQKKNTFTTRTIGGSLSISPGETGGPLRKRSDFNQALSMFNCLHQQAGGDQLEPILHLKYKQWRPASGSSSTWWQWQESWWSSQEFTESQEGRGKRRLVIERGQPVVYRTLAKTSDEWLSRIHFVLLQLGSFTVDGGQHLKNPFFVVKKARISGTGWVDDDSTKSDYNIQEKRTLYLELRMRGEMKWTYKTFLLNGETSRNDNVKTKIQSNINTKHMKPTMTWHTLRTRECARSC